MPQSKALEVNLLTSRRDVRIDPRYAVLEEIVTDYFGLRKTLLALLTEICHPLKNWEFILAEGRRFASQNFHLFKNHPRGLDGARLFVEVFLEAGQAGKTLAVRTQAADVLLQYLSQIVSDSGGELPRFLPVLNETFARLAEWPDDLFQPVVRGYYAVSRLAADLLDRGHTDGDQAPLIHLLKRYLVGTYRFWLSEPNPGAWFAAEAGIALSPDLESLFDPVSHRRLKELMRELDNLGGGGDAPVRLRRMPGFRDWIAAYEKIPEKLAEAGRTGESAQSWLIIALFQIMSLSGLSSIHERTLRDINRALSRLIGQEDPDTVRSLMDQTFRILTASIRQYPATALNMVRNMGAAVYQTGDADLVEFFLGAVIRLGFQTPDIRGVGDDWEVKANQAHIQNIRAWLELIEMNPARSKNLSSALVVSLALYGVFIQDTDLFPRDITALLNSDIRPVYHLVKQLGRQFPVYFNEIGAEGPLRDISTRIDEAGGRKDPLVHFLRKQSHVASSPQTVRLMEALLEFWRTRDKSLVEPLVPPGIYREIASDGPMVDGMHRLMTALVETGTIACVEDLLKLPEGALAAALAGVNHGASDTDRARLSLAHALYKMLHQKYFADRVGLEAQIDQFRGDGLPDLVGLKAALSSTDVRTTLTGLLDHLEALKAVILSPVRFEAREDIYHKRHIAVDIPSMYGTYHEPKFDALGLTFRLESLVNVLFQELIDGLDLKLITRGSFFRIYDYLLLFDRALRLDGIQSRELAQQLDLLAHSLDIRGFSNTQFLDIFRGLAEVVGQIVNDHFQAVHEPRLADALAATPVEALLPKYRSAGNHDGGAGLADRVTEIFLRDRIASSLGLQVLDQFVTRIERTLFHQAHELGADLLRKLLNYDPERVMTGLAAVKPDMADVVHLGAKAFNLARMTALGLPVPPGFVVTTEAFRCRESIEHYPPAREHFRNMLASGLADLSAITGKKFGDPARPLLLSARSGSSISMPGMLSTFLNVGINEAIVEGISRRPEGGPWFAWDCYRRFLQSVGMSRGLSRDDFDGLIGEFKSRHGLPLKRQFTGEQMRQVALAYRAFIRDHGLAVSDDPFEQLIEAVTGVFDSWTSPKAETYRNIMNISSDWGTAVTIQSMVFGNLSDRSGTGVFFTHNPRAAGDKLLLWGDFSLSNQGEDIVSGLVSTLPITRRQARIENRMADFTLETHFPEVYDRLLDVARKLIDEWGYSPQEMEFTFEGPSREDLYFLQTRDMALRERRRDRGFDPSLLRREDFLGHGIGVSGGGLSGRIVFGLKEIEHWRRNEPGTPLVLVRGDTVPDDIGEIHEADGLLTARGGSTSHAAIVAYRLQKTCVVGCAELVCRESDRMAAFGGTVLDSGDWISMDGLGGSIYRGRLPTESMPKKGA